VPPALDASCTRLLTRPGPHARVGGPEPRLEDVVAGSELVFPVRRLAPNGLEAWKQVVERGYDWLVAKDETSVYEGGPTKRWLKVKQKGWTVEEDRWQRRISVAPPGPLIAGRGSGWLAVRSRR